MRGSSLARLRRCPHFRRTKAKAPWGKIGILAAPEESGLLALGCLEFNRLNAKRLRLLVTQLLE